MSPPSCVALASTPLFTCVPRQAPISGSVPTPGGACPPVDEFMQPAHPGRTLGSLDMPPGKSRSLSGRTGRSWTLPGRSPTRGPRLRRGIFLQAAHPLRPSRSYLLRSGRRRDRLRRHHAESPPPRSDFVGVFSRWRLVAAAHHEVNPYEVAGPSPVARRLAGRVRLLGTGDGDADRHGPPHSRRAPPLDGGVVVRPRTGRRCLAPPGLDLRHRLRVRARMDP